MALSEYKEFRKLLEKAMGPLTQAGFAAKADLSVQYFNRMVNSKLINRPTDRTLKKIANAATNGVTYQELLDTVNKDDPDYGEETFEDIKLAEAKRDFAPTFDEKARSCFEDVKKAVDEIAGHLAGGFLTGLDTFMENVCQIYNRNRREKMDLSYNIDTPRQYFGDFCPDATHWTSVNLSFAEGVRAVESKIILFFSYLGKSETPVVQEASMGMKAVYDVFGLSDMQFENYKKKGLDISAAITEMFKEPFLLTHRTDLLYSEADTLLDEILSDCEEELVENIIYGLGFELEEVPAGYNHFVENHRQAVLSAYHDYPAEYDALSKKLDTLRNSRATSSEYADALSDYYNRSSEGHGWKEVISVVMAKETDFPFWYMAHSEPDDDFPNLSQTDVIILSDTHMPKGGRASVISIILKYGRELGIKTFGDLEFHYTLWEEVRHRQTFTISYDAPAPEKDNASDWCSAEHQPSAEGSYKVLLKDGRKKELEYKDRHWYGYAKNWDNWIQSYDSNPLPPSEV